MCFDQIHLLRPGEVAHTHNPNYSGGGDHSLRPGQRSQHELSPKLIIITSTVTHICNPSYAQSEAGWDKKYKTLPEK
jgi:hypothetical protein